MEYFWRKGSRQFGSAQDVGAYIEEMRQKNGGFIGAGNVIADAKKKRSPLHGYFEWDDSKAAGEHRLAQARELIGAIVFEREDVTVRGFVNVKIENESTYTSIDLALSDCELRAQVIERARREMVSWHQRYKDLKEFKPVHEAIKSAL